MPIPTWITIAIGVATGIILARVDYNMVFMKFFRDLSRSKARKRLHGNKFALVPMMLGIEKPIKIQDDIDAENQMTITREQLEEMDGFDGAPLYLSIKGRVYDVTAGSRFYGEGKEYHDWVGKDASRSFGMGCRGGVDRTGQECLSESLEGLEDKELKEIDRWLELYETHDKYTFVGYLVDDPVQEILENAGKESDEPVADDKESSGDDEESSNDLDENGKKIIPEELRKKIMSEF